MTFVPDRPAYQVPLPGETSNAYWQRMTDYEREHGIDPANGSYWDGGDVSDTLDVSMLKKGQMMPEKRRFPAVVTSGVRRLTPEECEALQGLPRGWTLPGSDSKRYAGLGDAVTANVAEWIGKRLLVHEAAKPTSSSPAAEHD